MGVAKFQADMGIIQIPVGPWGERLPAICMSPFAEKKNDVVHPKGLSLIFLRG